MLFRKKDKKIEKEYIERRIPVMDCKISSWIHKLEQVYEDEITLEELKEIAFLSCEQQENDWVVWRKCCYYGGCDFDPIDFKEEYEAYKYASIKSLLLNILKREHELSGAHTVLADVNHSCSKYQECTGLDY